MARTPDAHLSDRILDVALTLLRVRGEKGVTLRAVAESADTTTPTVYKRFPDKTALLFALALRERERYVQRQAKQKSLEAAAAGYLDWALHHPHEYRLIYGPLWPRVFSEETGRPGLQWSREQFSLRYGGRPDDYKSAVSALWLLLHGAASLLSQDVGHAAAEAIREECLEACRQVIESAQYVEKETVFVRKPAKRY